MIFLHLQNRRQDSQDLCPVAGTACPAPAVGILRNPQPLHIGGTAPLHIPEAVVHAGLLQGCRAGIGFQVLDLCTDSQLRRGKGIAFYSVAGHAHAAEIVLLQRHRRATKGEVPRFQTRLCKGNVPADPLSAAPSLR